MNTFRTLLTFFLFTLLSTPCFATLERDKKILEDTIENARKYILQKKSEQNDKIQKDSSNQKKEIWGLNVIRMEEEDWVFERIQSSLQNIIDLNGLIKLIENTNKIALSHINELEDILKENQNDYEHSYSFLRRIMTYWQHINVFCLRTLEGFSKNGHASSTRNVDEHHQSIFQTLSPKERRKYKNSLRNSENSEKSKNKLAQSTSSTAKPLKMIEAEKISEAIKKELFGTSDTSRKTEIDEFGPNPQERENHLQITYAPAALVEDKSFDEKITGIINESQHVPPQIPLRMDLIDELTIEKESLSSKNTTNTPKIPPRKDISVNDSNSQKNN